jgi:fatty-acyl-CoA synthase
MNSEDVRKHSVGEFSMECGESSLEGMLQPHAASGAIAFIERGATVSYAQLLQEARRVASGLSGLGVGQGDRVGIWLPNVSAWLVMLLACAQLGAIAVAVNTRFRSKELSDVLGRTGCKTLIYWPGFKSLDFASILEQCDQAAIEQLRSLIVFGSTEGVRRSQLLGRPVTEYRELASAAALDVSRPDSRDGVLIFTTSGTTGLPKFVLHSQANLVAHATDVAVNHRLQPTSVMMLVPPLCGVFGMCTALSTLAAGAALLVSATWDAHEAVGLIDTHGATHLNASDEAIAQILAATSRTPVLPTVSFVPYGVFNPSLGDIVARADARGLKLVGVGGQSEVQGLFSRQDESAPISERMKMGGWPVGGGTRVRARDPESEEILPDGEVGELEYFAPRSRMSGYFRYAEGTRSALTPDGWHRSGDLGYTEADGRFVLLSRMGDVMRLGGFLVSPSEIESVVTEVAGVTGCQVVGVDTNDGTRAVAFVTLEADTSFDEDRAVQHVKERLAKYKVPVRIVAIEAFPVTNGANATKIQKSKLRERARSLLAEMLGSTS